MVKISVYVVTKNEEVRLPKALAAVQPLADEIVVVDSGSEDRTEEIAKSYGARFIYHEWGSIGEQVAFAEQQCSYRWVLRIDADEVISDELAKEILAIKHAMNEGEPAPYDGYRLRSGEVFPGVPRPKRLVKHHQFIYFYDREAFRMSGKVGFDAVVPLKENPRVKLLHGFIHHYSYLTIERLVAKRNWASGQQMKRALSEGKRYSPWRMVFCMSLNFFKYFILDRYFLYGFWGYMHAVNVGYMRFLKFSKFYEQEQLAKYPYP